MPAHSILAALIVGALWLARSKVPSGASFWIVLSKTTPSSKGIIFHIRLRIWH